MKLSRLPALSKEAEVFHPVYNIPINKGRIMSEKNIKKKVEIKQLKNLNQREK
jgi:hypothetical protein